jgi:hypothetical protein
MAVNRTTALWGELVIRMANGLAPKGAAQIKLAQRAALVHEDGATSPQDVADAYERLLTPRSLQEACQGSRTTLVVLAVCGRGVYLAEGTLRKRADLWVSLASIRDAHSTWRRWLLDPDHLLPEWD